MSEENFTLPKTLKLAWLIRQDVRGDLDINDVDAQKNFVAWWFIYGQQHYSEIEPITDELQTILFQNLDAYPQHKGFGINRLLQYIYQDRGDVQSLFDIKTVEGVIGLNQWFYIYALSEYPFHSILSSDILEHLNQPMANFWSSQGQSELPNLSPLMFFAWFIRDDLQETFDIKSLEGRHHFLSWFFLQGVAEFGLSPLLDDYWLQWLNEEIPLNKGTSIPCATHLLWTFRDDLKEAFNIETEEGRQGLITWSKDALKTDPNYQWISHLRDQKNAHLGVNLIGFAFGELGIGEDVRMAAAACETADIPYTVINIQPGKEVRQNDQALANNITDHVNELKYKTNIFCLTGFDTAHVYLEKGAKLFEGRYNIGWWPWELPVWPQQWACAFDVIDEVWAATNYTKTMYQQSTNKPVTLMPLPVSVERMVKIERKELDLPEDTFLFLYTFDFNSYLHRKNPKAAVQAFIKAFPDKKEPVGLVLKTMNSNGESKKWKKFKKLCQEDERIILIEKTLDREKVLGLLDACDAYLSLHRAEGFGRTPAEAMLLNKPVIATDFSGNTDFVTQKTGFPVKWHKKPVKIGQYPFVIKKDNAYWADPDISHAAKQMQLVFNTTYSEESTQKIQRFAQEQFSLSRIGQLMKDQLIKNQHIEN